MSYTILQPTDTSSEFPIHYPGLATRNRHFEIHSLQWLFENQLQENTPKEMLSLYEIYWFKKGDGFFEVDDSRYPISNNTVFFLVPGQMKICTMDGISEGYRLSFSHDFLFAGTPHTLLSTWQDTLSSGEHVRMIHSDPELDNEMDDILRKMEREFSNYFLLRSELLSGLLNILIIHFSRKLQKDTYDLPLSRESELARRFKHLLKHYIASKKQVADYAGILCVTPNYLNRTVKKITGFTASYHIQQQIILEAKRKAMHSSYTMKEIAYSLGFDNLAHFSKFFKNNSGMSFTDFRKNITEDFVGTFTA